ncbi:MAG TPA: sigma-70 family RNA polymerase sigma factor [Polyangiaceae bacterium]
MSAVSTAIELDSAFESQLIEDCAEGDALAWRKLHRKYYPVAAAFLRKLGVRERDLEDATQDVFLQMYKYLPRFRRQAELSTWLYRLCITQARHTRRKARVTETLLSLLSILPSASLLSEPAFSEDLAKQRIAQALATLPEGERSVFVLYEMEGLPGKQIAEIVKCPEATVWRRLHYARRTFREALGVDPETAS